MSQTSFIRSRLGRGTFLIGLSAAVMVTAVFAAVAIAKTFTLEVARQAKVTNQSGKTVRANIVISSRGLALYTLTGDSRQHPECTKANGCFAFWVPVKVSSARKLTRAPGISGKLGTWRRNHFLQVLLGGHPLYTFAGDANKDHATGEGIVSFGGTWHVARAKGAHVGSGGMTTTPPSPPTAPGY